MKRDFKDKVVLVTGGTGNLGQAISRAFAQQGAKLVAIDLHPRAGPNVGRKGCLC